MSQARRAGETAATTKTSMGPPIKSGDDEVEGRAKGGLQIGLVAP